MEQQQKRVIGVDLGGTNMRAGRIYGQTLEAEASFPTPAHAQTQEETIEALIRVIEAVWDNSVQAIGIGVPSRLGMLTFSISPFLTFVQRVVSRALTGYLLGLIFKGVKKVSSSVVGFFVTGFCAAILNFVFFMGLLVLCFGSNADVANIWAGKTAMAYLVATFMSNTIFEIIVTTLLTGLVCLGLYKAKLLNAQ